MADGSVRLRHVYKTRLVVKGCLQRPGIDFENFYVLAVRCSTIRYLMAMATKHNLKIDGDGHRNCFSTRHKGRLHRKVQGIHRRSDEGLQTEEGHV